MPWRWNKNSSLNAVYCFEYFIKFFLSSFLTLTPLIYYIYRHVNKCLHKMIHTRQKIENCLPFYLPFLLREATYLYINIFHKSLRFFSFYMPNQINSHTGFYSKSHTFYGLFSAFTVALLENAHFYTEKSICLIWTCVLLQLRYSRKSCLH